MDDRITRNRMRWDETALLHTKTYFRDGTALDAELKAFELEELGDLEGTSVCHLQCHIGGDSLSLARLGANVVGVDFSAAAVEIARRRAQQAGMAHRMSFVCATVEQAPHAAGTGFDGVYTSWGVLCWLPDLAVWASTIKALLRPGGWLYLAETHPYATALRGDRSPYGGNAVVHKTGPGDYTDPHAELVHDESWEWSHGLGEIVTAVADAGLRIEYLHERPVATWNLADPNLVAIGDGTWKAPDSTVPLSFTLRATNS